MSAVGIPVLQGGEDVKARGMAVRACVLSCEEQIKRGAQPAASWGVQRVTVRGSACPQVETYFEVGGE